MDAQPGAESSGRDAVGAENCPQQRARQAAWSGVVTGLVAMRSR
jgi:hypothetical protein